MCTTIKVGRYSWAQNRFAPWYPAVLWSLSARTCRYIDTVHRHESKSSDALPVAQSFSVILPVQTKRGGRAALTGSTSRPWYRPRTTMYLQAARDKSINQSVRLSQSDSMVYPSIYLAGERHADLLLARIWELILSPSSRFPLAG